MDTFPRILDAASAVYLAADAAKINKAQCALLKERLQHMLSALQRLSNDRREAFAASPTGCALLATLESAAALCSAFGQAGGTATGVSAADTRACGQPGGRLESLSSDGGQKSWLAGVFAADMHAAQFEEIQRRLGGVVDEAALSVAVPADEQRAAAASDAADAQKLVAMLEEEQRAGFQNVQAGQGERA